MSEPELWLARDGDGRLYQFIGSPQVTYSKEWDIPENLYFVCGDADGDDLICHLNDSLFPELQPGQKARVRLVVEARETQAKESGE